MKVCAHAAAGWSIPSPLRPSRFVSLWPEHDVHNVEVDVAALKASGCATGARHRSLLLYSDLQSLPGMAKGDVLGLENSGHHLGRFLKGVGRSGYLPASRGIRELVVTRYLESKGFGHTIVGCQGLLLAPLDPRLRDFARRGASIHDLAPIDQALQAITVRDGHFARASNFVWLLDHAWRGVTTVFFSNLRRFLGADGDEASALAHTLGDSAVRLLDAHEDALRAGVSWGSAGAISTLDGRVLDLETAIVLGRPLVGVRAEGVPPALGEDGRAVVGCEALPQLMALGAALDHLRQRLVRLVAKGLISHPIERGYVAEFLSALERELGDDHHPLHGRAAACAHVTDRIGRVLDLPSAAREKVRELVEAYHDFLALGCSPEGGWPLAFSPARAPVSADVRAARELNGRLAEIDRQTTVEGALEAVRGLLDDMTPAVATAASW